MEKEILKNEEMQELLYQELENGYDEVIISGEYANRKKRNTRMIVERTTEHFKITFDCDNYFDGRENYNTLEEIISVVEI